MVTPVSNVVLFALLATGLGLVFYGSTKLSQIDYPAYLCMDFDGKSSYKVREDQLRNSSALVKGQGYINGILVSLYIPKSNLIGCVEIENAQ